MPKSGSGRFFANPQMAARADRAGGAKSGAKPDAAEKPASAHGASADHETGDSSELKAHGDGRYTTKTGGSETEHPSLGHALVHLAGHHEPEGDHVHMHHDGLGGVTSHHSKDGGEVQGPHEHESPDDAGEHAKNVMNGEDGIADPIRDGDEEMDMAGMRGMSGL